MLLRLAHVPLAIAVSIARRLHSLHLLSLREVYGAVNQRSRCRRAHLSLGCPTTLTLSLLLLILGLYIPGLRDLLRQRILDDASLCLEVGPRRRAAAHFFFGPRGLVWLINLRDIDPRSLDYTSFLILELP